MKSLNLIKHPFNIIFFMLLSCFIYSQQGNVSINQDKKITTLLELKKELNKDDDSSDSYKINIFSGSRSGAESSEVKFRSSFNKWRTKLIFDTPNYKILVGSYRTRLEADRALKEIKTKFPNAFIFKPKKG